MRQVKATMQTWFSGKEGSRQQSISVSSAISQVAFRTYRVFSQNVLIATISQLEKKTRMKLCSLSTCYLWS